MVEQRVNAKPSKHTSGGLGKFSSLLAKRFLLLLSFNHLLARALFFLLSQSSGFSPLGALALGLLCE
jgi:hypothetical protein